MIPRLKTTWLKPFWQYRRRLNEISLDIDNRAAATVMAVSGGYPGNYEKGFEIEGLEILNEEDVIVFHAVPRSKTESW